MMRLLVNKITQNYNGGYWLVLGWVSTKENHLLLRFDASKPSKYGV
jgi:hypothetical protein